jgi:4'-phosphopantetheinyl transferase
MLKRSIHLELSGEPAVNHVPNDQAAISFQSLAALQGAEPPALFPDTMHVWGISLGGDERPGSLADSLLSSDERERASRFVSPIHREQFAAAHGALRLILSRYCQRRPGDLHFERTAKGKPFLTDVGDSTLRFNLSHSHGRALVAVTRGREVGIDLEKVRPTLNAARLAQRFLSLREQQFIADVEPANQHERFLQVWVAREAAGKAEGRGITFPWTNDSLEIDLTKGEGRFRREAGDRLISIRFLTMEAGWFGAAAAQGEWRLIVCTTTG